MLYTHLVITKFLYRSAGLNERFGLIAQLWKKLSPEEKQVLVTACLLARILRDNSPCSLILSVTTNVKVCPKNPSSQHFSGFSSEM